MIYDVNSMLFRSFLSAAGLAKKPQGGDGGGHQRRPGEGKKDNKPPMME
jgi:hypothetical protein